MMGISKQINGSTQQQTKIQSCETNKGSNEKKIPPFGKLNESRL